MKLVFTGIQGCGKGTQARLLVEKYGFTLLEMGGELRKIAASDTPLGKKVKEVMEAGHQVSPEIVGEIIQEIHNNYKDEKVIFDGFVRNDGNKQSLDEVCHDYTVVFFDLSKEKAMDRLLGRMYNPTTGETFPSNVIVDPKTGEKLIKRLDDNEDSIMNRINAFVDITLPTVEKHKQDGNVIIINADQPIEEVHNDLVIKLGINK